MDFVRRSINPYLVKAARTRPSSLVSPPTRLVCICYLHSLTHRTSCKFVRSCIHAHAAKSLGEKYVWMDGWMDVAPAGCHRWTKSFSHLVSQSVRGRETDGHYAIITCMYASRFGRFYQNASHIVMDTDKTLTHAAESRLPPISLSLSLCVCMQVTYGSAQSLSSPLLSSPRSPRHS